MKNWRLGDFNDRSKWIDLYGPNEIHAKIDYDDVNQEVVAAAARRMVEVLNGACQEGRS